MDNNKKDLQRHSRRISASDIPNTRRETEYIIPLPRAKFERLVSIIYLYAIYFKSIEALLNVEIQFFRYNLMRHKSTLNLFSKQYN